MRESTSTWAKARFVEEFFGPDTTLLPEVPQCGRSEQHAARPGLWTHQHPGAFEVCLIARGEVEWWVADRIFTVRAGQVFVTYPDEPHGAVGSVLHRCELHWFQLADPARVRWPGMTPAEATALCLDLRRLPTRSFEASPELRQAIRGVVDEHCRLGYHRQLAARASLYMAVVLLVREGQRASAPVLSPPVRQALAWINEHVERSFAVAEVADVVGLSEVRLQARFQRELHCSVAEYHTRLRVHAAKVLLRDTNRSVTAIAAELGFSSSQYFATVFRKYAGRTPSAYRARVD